MRVRQLFNIGYPKAVFGVFIFSLILFGLLIFKDPFSQRTLIPNFEPFPDTFYYVTPAWNFVRGEGFALSREGRAIYKGVPPLYSIILIPGFALNHEPRFFFITNVLLSFMSFFLFFKIVISLTKSIFITLFSLIVYATNTQLYWYPTLAMAENLSITLFLLALYLLTIKVSKKTALLMAFASVGLYATKYVSLPLTWIFFGLFILKWINFKRKALVNFKVLLVFVGAYIIFYSLFALFEFKVHQDNILSIFSSLFSTFAPIQSSSPSGGHINLPPNASPWFSSSYLSKNLPVYLRALIGEPIRVLWNYNPLLSKLIAIPGLAGIFFGVYKKRFRFLAFSLILTLLLPIFFISTFYASDGRYIDHAIPAILIGFSIFLSFLESLMTGRAPKRIFYLLIAVFFIFFTGSSIKPIRSQLSLNFKYAETPWYYVAVLEFNKYFNNSLTTSDKKPILITALPPFLIDYYTNGNYSLLPLSKDQDFRDQKELVWGPNDYSDLFGLYDKYLQEGYILYVTNADLGNDSYTNIPFINIRNRYKFEKVDSGCVETCNIYKISLKPKQ